MVPVIPNITKGWHDHNIRKNFDKIVAVSARSGIAVVSHEAEEELKKAGLNRFRIYTMQL